MNQIANKNNNDKEESLVSHLNALREMLIHSILVVALFTPAGFYIAPKFIKMLVQTSFGTSTLKLHYFSPMEVFILQLKIGVLLAFILSFPFVINEIRKFVFPALYKNEKKFISVLVLSSTFLFLFGALICMFFVLPLIMKFALSFSTSSIEATLGLENFINLCISLIVAFGLMFQFPLFVLLGVKFSLVEVKTLKNLRPYVVVGILILAAILTPPDIVSQLILATPTYLLFEIGLYIASKIETND